MKTEVGKHNGIKYLLFRDRIGNQQGHSYKGNPWRWFLYAGTNSRDGDCYVGDFDRKADAYAELDARSNPDHPFHPHGHDFNVQNHGSIFILEPDSQEAVSWCDEHLPDDAMRWGKNGYVVEHRYIAGIVKGLNTAGLKGHAL